jgi:predicted ATPase/tRNA A37 threonylcarbamoyladenosine biosynthesis protein TsaE
MRLKSVSLKHHKIIGTTKINFFGDSTSIKQNLKKQYSADIEIDVDTKNKENYYTYIIGQNGIGKTALFRTIINFININSPLREPKLDSLIKLYKKSRRYLNYYRDNGHSELVNLNIYNYWWHKENRIGVTDLLEHFNSYLISINSSFERQIIHANPRYRSFNYLSDINRTKTLFAKALIKFTNSPKLKVLSDILERENTVWGIRGEIAIDAFGGIDDKRYAILLKNNNGINIINFLTTIKKIRISSNDTLETNNLESKDIVIFEAIYNSSSFFKFYFDYNISFKELFEKIKNSSVLKKIEEFIHKNTDYSDVESTLNIRILKDQRKNWEFLFSNVNDISNFDLNILLLLESLDLIDLDIFCNDINIEHMSSGEQSIIRLFSFFSDIPIQKQNLIVFFDEPENTLHPKWQQSFPIYFKRIIEDVYEITSSHFIFSTHSPLVIMKSVAVKKSNVLQFFKDENAVFHSRQIENINSFSVEEVLLDEFNISYRDRKIQNNIQELLDNKRSDISSNSDPINSIPRSFDLKKKIDDLYNSIQSKE